MNQRRVGLRPVWDPDDGSWRVAQRLPVSTQGAGGSGRLVWHRLRWMRFATRQAAEQWISRHETETA